MGKFPFRRFVGLSIAFFAFALAGQAAAQPVKIRKIEVETDASVGKDFVASRLFEISVGSILEESQLADALEIVETRLLSTGLWSAVSAISVASQSEEGSVNVVVEAIAAFPYEFSGADAYASFGWKNFDERASDVRVSLGWNRQSLDFTGRSFDPVGRAAFAVDGFFSLGNFPSSYVKRTRELVRVQDLGAEAGARWSLPWGWSIETSAFWALSWGASSKTPEETGVQMISLTFDRSDSRISRRSGLRIQTEGLGLWPNDAYKASIDARAWFGSPVERLKFAVRSKIEGITNLEVADGRYAPCLRGANGVRKSFEIGDVDSATSSTSAELRWEAFEILAFSFATVRFEPAVFVDVGTTLSRLGDSASWSYSAGMAVRMFVDPPVGLAFSFDYGFDRLGQGSVFFAVEKQF